MGVSFTRLMFSLANFREKTICFVLLSTVSEGSSGALFLSTFVSPQFRFEVVGVYVLKSEKFHR